MTSQYFFRNCVMFFVVMSLSAIPLSANGGEISGNTFTSTKYGHFQISSPDGKWIIKDSENNIPYVCEMSGKEPGVIKVMGFDNKTGVFDDQTMISISKGAFEGMGFQITSSNTVDIAGKKVTVLLFKGQQQGIQMVGHMYIFRGEQAYFNLIYVVPESAEKAAEPHLQTVLATIKY